MVQPSNLYQPTYNQPSSTGGRGGGRGRSHTDPSVNLQAISSHVVETLGKALRMQSDDRERIARPILDSIADFQGKPATVSNIANVIAGAQNRYHSAISDNLPQILKDYESMNDVVGSELLKFVFDEDAQKNNFSEYAERHSAYQKLIEGHNLLEPLDTSIIDKIKELEKDPDNNANEIAELQGRWADTVIENVKHNLFITSSDRKGADFLAQYLERVDEMEDRQDYIGFRNILSDSTNIDKTGNLTGEAIQEVKGYFSDNPAIVNTIDFMEENGYRINKKKVIELSALHGSFRRGEELSKLNNQLRQKYSTLASQIRASHGYLVYKGDGDNAFFNIPGLPSSGSTERDRIAENFGQFTASILQATHYGQKPDISNDALLGIAMQNAGQLILSNNIELSPEEVTLQLHNYMYDFLINGVANLSEEMNEIRLAGLNNENQTEAKVKFREKLREYTNENPFAQAYDDLILDILDL